MSFGGSSRKSVVWWVLAMVGRRRRLKGTCVVRGTGTRERQANVGQNGATRRRAMEAAPPTAAITKAEDVNGVLSG